MPEIDSSSVITSAGLLTAFNRITMERPDDDGELRYPSCFVFLEKSSHELIVRAPWTWRPMDQARVEEELVRFVNDSICSVKGFYRGGAMDADDCRFVDEVAGGFLVMFSAADSEVRAEFVASFRRVLQAVNWGVKPRHNKGS